MPEQDKYTGLAVRFKRQMNDIIDAAYPDVDDRKKAQYKRFRIYCLASERRSKLGHCKYLPDGSSEIKLFCLSSESANSTLVTAIHEVAHHIDKANRGASGHDAPFYNIHKHLLFAAFDLSILTIDDVINSDSSGRDKNKLARMMSDYIPSPSATTAPSKTQIHVYNAYKHKDQLKAHGYTWNSLDAAWTLSCDENNVEREMSHLQKIGVPAGDVRIHKGNGVVTRLRKVVTLHDVPFDANATVKNLGYRFVKERGKPLWRKQIDGNDLAEAEKQTLRKIGARWEVSK